MYEIKFDRTAKRLELRLWGFWTDETLQQFAAALRDEAAAARAGGKTFDLLSDASALPVQTPAIAAQFGDLIHSLHIEPQGKVAVIVTTKLNKMQAERIRDGSQATIFSDRATAIRWLSDPA